MRRRTRSDRDPSSGSTGTILVVDNIPTSVNWSRSTSLPKGFRVSASTTAPRPWQSRSHPPDLIILDFDAPLSATGWKSAGNCAKNTQTPIIMLDGAGR